MTFAPLAPPSAPGAMWVSEKEGTTGAGEDREQMIKEIMKERMIGDDSRLKARDEEGERNLEGKMKGRKRKECGKK